jgi:beta-lactamase regulating signal transducer with metallopeptidase domain/Flp pilus assembly protein TadD
MDPLLPTGPAGFALEVVVKVTCLLALAGCLVPLVIRSSAAWRHHIWRLAVVSSLLMPLFVMLPGWQLTVPIPAHSAAVLGLGPAARPDPTPVEAPTMTSAIMVLPDSTIGPVMGSPHEVSRSPAGASTLLVGIWALGVLLLAARVLAGLYRAHGLTDKGVELRDHADLGVCRRLLGIRRPVRLVANPDVGVPMTCGSLRPVLLVPADFVSWSAPRQRVVLLHELAHVRRWDCLAQLLGQATTALYWFHPLAWLAEHRLRREAEKASDDMVLELGTRASEYAGHLLAIIRTLVPGRRRAIASVAMAGTLFEERLSAILEPNRKRGPMSRNLGIVAAAALAVGLGLFGAMQVAAKTPGTDDTNAETSSASALNSPNSAHAEHWTVPDDTVLIAGKQRYEDSARQDHDAHIKKLSRVGAKAFKLGYKHYEDKHYADAIDAFRQAADEGFQPATSMFNVACCYALSGDNSAALDWLERAMEAGFSGPGIETDEDLRSLRDDPRFQRLREQHRALLAERRARGETVKDVYGDVMDKYRQLVDSNDQDGNHWYKLGLMLHKLGEYDLAIEAWERARELGTKPGATTYNIACAQSLKGEIHSALVSLEQAVEAGYGSRKSFDHDGDLDNLREEPRYREIAELADALALPKVAHYQASGEFMRPAWAAAVERYEQHLAGHPRSGRAWFNLGYAALQIDRPDTAVDAYERAFDLGYRQAVSAYNLACAHARNRDSNAAFRWLDTAFSMNEKLKFNLISDPDMDNLRDDPRFPDTQELERVKDEWKKQKQFKDQALKEKQLREKMREERDEYSY